MQPRLKSSKKWTAFPREFCTQIEEVFKENFAEYLANGQLIVDGRIYPDEVMLRVGYLEKGRLKQVNFETSMNYHPEEQDTVDRIHNCIDAAASMMNDYFENDGDVDFPYSWKEFTFQNQKVYLQFSTENSSLEAQANALLGKEEEGLLQDEKTTDDALEHSEFVHDDDDDDDSDEAGNENSSEDSDEENPQPRMFSGKKPSKKNQLH